MWLLLNSYSEASGIVPLPPFELIIEGAHTGRCISYIVPITWKEDQDISLNQDYTTYKINTRELTKLVIDVIS